MVNIYGSGAGDFGNTAMVGSLGHLWISDFTTQLVQKIDYEDKQQPVYIGLAMPGTNVGSADWMIRNYVLSGNPVKLVTAVLFGSGNANFDKVWDDRSGTSAAYS